MEITSYDCSLGLFFVGLRVLIDFDKVTRTVYRYIYHPRNLCFFYCFVLGLCCTGTLDLIYLSLSVCKMTAPHTRQEDDSSVQETAETTTTALWTVAKLVTAAVLCAGAFSMQQQPVEQPVEQQDVPTAASSSNHRRLTEEENANQLPLAAQTSPLAAELQPLFQDLTKREKLFADTPPEEVKYWFEYTDPLQVGLFYILLCVMFVCCLF